MNKILVTGGAGFIGYFLVKKLLEDQNNQVIVIDNMARGRLDDDFSSLLENENLKFIQADLTDEKTYQNLPRDLDFVYHLAAVIGVKNVIENPDKVLYVNAISTLHLVEFLKEVPTLKKVLFSSTSEIYAGTLKHFGIEVPTNEEVALTLDDVSSPRTTYMLSKMYGESIFFNYGEKYNIPFTIVRYHNVYGPRMGFLHVVPEMFIKISNQDTIEVVSAEHTRAFCYVDDALQMTILACQSSNTNKEIVNIGNQDEEISIGDLVKKIANTLEKDIKIIPKSATQGSPSRRCPDITKIVSLIDFQPKISLEEGLSKTYEWYKDKLESRYE